MNKKLYQIDNEIAWEKVTDKVYRKIMCYDENIMMVKVKFEKGGIGALHKHHHVQATYVESGVFEVNIGGELKTLKAGDTFFVTSNIEHGVVNIEEGILVDVFNPAREDFLK
ncbi:MAG: cupin domain-containing protein [Melioribacteraceae bacterium]|nr:MAG: cupin domain-containing protein [Melioribacteraceae bacterium]